MTKSDMDLVIALLRSALQVLLKEARMTTEAEHKAEQTQQPRSDLREDEHEPYDK